MAVQSTPYVETALSHSAELFRRELQSGLPLGSAGGVVPATPASSANLTAGVAGCSDLQVSAPVSGMSVNISAGQAVVCGTLGSGSGYGMGTGYAMPTVTLNGGSAPTVASNAHAVTQQLTTQGAYYVYNDDSSGAVNLAISSADPSNPRIDVVVAQVEDAGYSGSNNDWKLAVVTGTAASSPVVPTLPASALVLAYVWVPAAASSIVSADILDLRVAYNRNPFRAGMYRSASYTDSSTSDIAVPYDTVAYDLTGSITIGSSEFTCPVGGIWAIDQCTTFSGTSADRYLSRLFRNGSEYRHFDDGEPGASNYMALNGACLAPCNEGDILTVHFQSVTASSTAFFTGAVDVYVDFVLVSPL